jgi:N-carbamoyl-L-amino-acid hydrolase
MLQPQNVIADLKELRILTGNEDGAQRVAWTETWLKARAWEREKLKSLPLDVEIDEAGNQWFTLQGESEEAVIIGGHIDSVPNGGWLDGCLNLIAGYEVMRCIAIQGRPPLTVKLVDWADEEGRFGYSLLGSSAVSGSLNLDRAKGLKDKNGIKLVDELQLYGVDINTATLAKRQLNHAKAYVELHIEQGPVLEAMGLPLGVVIGTFGVERHLLCFTGQSAHAGSTPMHMRHDALSAGARLALSIRDISKEYGGVGTVGQFSVKPGIMTAVAGICEFSLDFRHINVDALQHMLAMAKNESIAIAAEENTRVEWHCVFQKQPIRFDEQLIELAEMVIQKECGACHRLPSGPLHDATEVAQRGIPTVMLFVRSLRGLSHTKEEDSLELDIEMSVRALYGVVTKILEKEKIHSALMQS